MSNTLPQTHVFRLHGCNFALKNKNTKNIKGEIAHGTDFVHNLTMLNTMMFVNLRLRFNMSPWKLPCRLMQLEKKPGNCYFSYKLFRLTKMSCQLPKWRAFDQ